MLSASSSAIMRMVFIKNAAGRIKIKSKTNNLFSMRYDKLVRDGIPEKIAKNGGKPKIHYAESGEYWIKLKEKLWEEIKEFDESEEIEEVADILEVLDAVCEFKGFALEEVASIKKEKFEKRGGFRQRIILEED